MARARHGQAGFTLVELLVAMTLLGLIVVVLTGALQGGLAGSERVDAQAERLNELRLAQAFIRRHVEAARPVQWTRDRRAVVAFEGRADTLDFVAVMPAWPARGGIYLVRLAFEDGDLVMTRRITSGEPAEFRYADGVERRVLARDVVGGGFTYFGAPADGRRAAWRDDWTGQHTMPDLVALALDYADPAAGRWPDLVMAPTIGIQPR